jgi:tetratricopeptide (TPR) repeat protein
LRLFGQYSIGVGCPSEEEIAALLDGDIKSVERSTLELHVEHCSECQLLWRRLFGSSTRTGTIAAQDAAQPEGGSHGVDGTTALIEAAVDQALSQSAAHEDHDPRVGQRVGRYELRRLLGMGGMGRVYAAHDPELDREVAIKLLRADLDTQSEELRGRLLREAQAMARLSHPNVISVFDVGLHGDQVFVAMELIDGQTLRHWLDADLRPWREVLRVLSLAGRGLAAAHEVGIVHRDFKPDNVMIARNGSVRVLDFGLARAVADAPRQLGASPMNALTHSLTGTAGLVGTPAYMAPEQLACEATDTRTDQFSFCVALYQGLTGTRPFVGTTPQALLAAIHEGRKDTTREAQIPSWIRPILARGLRVNPDDRFASMAELLTALERDPALVRRRWLIGLATVAAVAGVAVAANHQARRHASLVCRGAESQLSGIWDAPRREKMQSAFLGTKLSFASDAFTGTARVLDQYAQSWLAMRTDACQATRVRGEQSEEVMQLRMECLESRREELRAVVDVFTQPDAQVVQRALSSATNLSGLDECKNTEALRTIVRPPAGAVQARVAAVRTQLAQVKALRSAGRYKDGLDHAVAVVDAARELAYQPLLAEALTERASLEMRNGQNEAAFATLFAAATAAEAGRYDRQLAAAMRELVYVASEKLSRFEDAQLYYGLARAALTRAGSEPTLETYLEQYEVTALSGLARYDEALTLQKRVLERTKELALDVGLSLSNLGDIYRLKGDFEHAISCFRQAIAAYESSYGPNHPRTGLIWDNLGAALVGKQDWVQAERAFRRALAILEAALGPDHPDVAQALSNLSAALKNLGQFNQALAVLERSQAIYENTGSRENLIASFTEENFGEVLLKLGRLDAALAHALHALAIREHLLNSQHPYLAESLVLVGQIRLDRNEAAQALPLLERAVGILEKHGSDPALLAQGRFALARALWNTGGDRARARSLAIAARENAGDERAEVDAWLAQHH